MRDPSGCSLNYLGHLEQDVLGDGEPEHLGGLEVDREVELAGLLDQEACKRGAFTCTF